ncbi:MAG: LytTR family transcriptional regulator [Pseudomonadales bacterium]|nr:LytTR family transcriptional regulator [Pseudomonadales bacterium]
MTLSHYLANRHRYELIAVLALLLLIVIINVTTIGMEFERDGVGPGWREAWATESTSVFSLGVLLLPLFYVFKRLDLTLANFRQKWIWLLPIFFGFSLLHVAGFVVLRKVLWAMGGQQYTFDPLLLELIYELRKDFLDFLIIFTLFYSYQFIIDRLRGEARFLDVENQQDNQRLQFLVKMLDREYLVKVEDIDWVQSASNYVVLHCGERHYPMRQTLKSLNDELSKSQFMRVHRTAIVNLQRVVDIQEKGELGVHLVSGELVPLSKTYLPELRNALSKPKTVSSVSVT